MKKVIFLILLILIFPNILFATDCAWLLWEYSVFFFPVPKEPGTGRWSLINALDSRNECIETLIMKYIDWHKIKLKGEDDIIIAGKYENKEYGIKEEVSPKLDKAVLSCLKSFNTAQTEDIIKKYKNKEAVNEPTKSEFSEFMSKACKNILTYNTMDDTKGIKSKTLRHESESKEAFFITEYEFWCLPASVNPKTIGND
jgi:hypothetical protein